MVMKTTAMMMKAKVLVMKTTVLVIKTTAPVMKVTALVMKTTALVLVKSMNLLLELLLLHRCGKGHSRILCVAIRMLPCLMGGLLYVVLPPLKS